MDDLSDPLPPSAFVSKYERFLTADQLSDSRHFLVEDSNSHVEQSEGSLTILSSKISMYQSRVRDLESELHLLRQSNEQLKRSRDEAHEEISCLKNYIGSDATLRSPVPTKSAQQEERFADFARLQSECYQKEQENVRLKQELELAQVRINSLDSLIKLQERKLCQSSQLPNDKTSKLEALLTAWRTHVLHLLFEQENHKVELEHAKQKLKRQQSLASEKLADACNEQQVLKLKLQSVEAGFRSLEQKYEHVKTQLDMKTEALILLQQRYSTLFHSAHSSLSKIHARLSVLDSSTRSTSVLFDKSSFRSQVINKLNHLERRLNFACNRLPVLKTLLRNSCKKLNRSTQTDQRGAVEFDMSELDRLRMEKDIALRKLEANERIFEDRLRESRKEGEEEMMRLKQSISDLEERVKCREEELLHCREELSRSKASNEHTQQELRIERDKLEANLRETEQQLAVAKCELLRAERHLSREIKSRESKLSELKETALSSDLGFLPMSLRVSAGSVTNSADLRAIARSLVELNQLVKSLDSDRSDEEGESDLP